MTNELLAGTLAIAVPMWVERLKATPQDQWPDPGDLAQFIAEKGDIILYASKKKGETADAFNKLAQGIALLSFAPGGVTALGEHWESSFGDPAR